MKDELIAQVNPFYSNAVGGVKLQVKESDLELALEILNEGGYAPEKKIKGSQFFTQVDKISSKIPLINQFNYEIRFLIMAGTLIIVVVCLIIVLIDWCYA